MTIEIPADQYLGVGPYPDVYGHGPVTIFNNGNPEEGIILVACLDCGFVTADRRYLLHKECDRSKNAINQTWRGLIESDGFPEKNPE